MSKWTAKGRVWFLFGLPAFQMERPRLMQWLTMVNRPLEANIGVVIIAVSKINWLLWNIKIWLLPQGWVVAAQTSRPTTSSTIRSSTVQCVREVGTCGEDEDNCTFYSFCLVSVTWLGLLKKRGSVLAASIIRMLVLSGDCGCVRTGNREFSTFWSFSCCGIKIFAICWFSASAWIACPPGKDKRKNLDEGNEDAATDVGKKERQNVPPQASSQHCHATVHIDCALRVEILKKKMLKLLFPLKMRERKWESKCWWLFAQRPDIR